MNKTRTAVIRHSSSSVKGSVLAYYFLAVIFALSIAVNAAITL